MIRYLNRKDIDLKRWDKIIRSSPYATFYAFSWYLDAAAENWSALIYGDYRYIMPLTWKKRFGFHYLYQPLFTQQLGVFSTEIVPPDVVREFLLAIPKKFRFGDQQFNTGNLLGEEEGFEVSDRVNYELRLDKNYHYLYSDFSENSRRNLRKAYSAGLELRYDTGMNEIIHFKKNLSQINWPEEHYFRIRDLFTTLAAEEKVQILSTHLNGKICAAALFGICDNRAVYLYSASDDTGKETRAMFLIIDQFIRDNEEKDMILDFEGSSIPSIARFFAGFGAKPAIYQQVSYTRLPGYMNKFKKHAGNR